MRRTLTVLALLLGLPLSVAACLWDRDTPADEARGMPDVVAVLTGRFVRNPPLFYEMRLARVTAQIENHPKDLALYDDASVACDRLGRGDEAIAWMKKKQAQIEKLDGSRPEVKDERYRYHANLGTFLVHRWVRQGADRTRIAEVKAARDQIAQALAINPNAHFGREKYQMRALEWIVNPPMVGDSSDLPNFLGLSYVDFYSQRIDPKEADDAVRGLVGLIMLGNAWESVDIFHALTFALMVDSSGYERSLEGGRTSLAYFASLRCRELVDAGKGSMLPDAPKGEALKSLTRLPIPKAELLLDPAFQELRAHADAWQAARTAFMTRRLKEGRHPDTDPSFWDGYTDRPAPGLPTKTVLDAYNAWLAARRRRAWLVNVGVGVPVLGGLVAGSLAFRSARARRRKAQAVKDIPREPEGGIRG